MRTSTEIKLARKLEYIKADLKAIRDKRDGLIKIDLAQTPELQIIKSKTYQREKLRARAAPKIAALCDPILLAIAVLTDTFNANQITEGPLREKLDGLKDQTWGLLNL